MFQMTEANAPPSIELLTKRKTLAIILGNTGDLEGLLKMLSIEQDEGILRQVITSIGALGNSQAIPHLKRVANSPEYSPKTRKTASNAIEVISEFSKYSI